MANMLVRKPRLRQKALEQNSHLETFCNTVALIINNYPLAFEPKIYNWIHERVRELYAVFEAQQKLAEGLLREHNRVLATMGPLERWHYEYSGANGISALSTYTAFHLLLDQALDILPVVDGSPLMRIALVQIHKRALSLWVNQNFNVTPPPQLGSLPLQYSLTSCSIH